MIDSMIKDFKKYARVCGLNNEFYIYYGGKYLHNDGVVRSDCFTTDDYNCFFTTQQAAQAFFDKWKKKHV